MNSKPYEVDMKLGNFKAGSEVDGMNLKFETCANFV